MYWSLQQQTEDQNSFPSPEASPAPSVCGEDENFSIGGEFSNLSVDDTTSDSTASSQPESDGVAAADELL